MKKRTVKEIILPAVEGLPPYPFVTMEDGISHAIELLVKYNLKNIAVVLNKQMIGRVCLKDALKTMGIQGLPKKGVPDGFEE